MSDWFLTVGGALLLVILFTTVTVTIVDWLARTKVTGRTMVLAGVLAGCSLVLAGVLAKAAGQ